MKTTKTLKDLKDGRKPVSLERSMLAGIGREFVDFIRMHHECRDIGSIFRQLTELKMTDGDEAVIRFAYWNEWSGLVVKEVRCHRVGDGVRFGCNRKGMEVLVGVDCGVCY